MRAPEVRVLTAVEAVSEIPDGATLLIEGSGGGLLEPDLLLEALGRRYRADRHPRDLDVVFVTAIGDNAGGGMDHLAQDGMVRRAVGGMWGKAPRFAAMALAGDFEAYNFPQGVLSQLCRDVAAGRPGLITRTGLDTFCDPRLGGGALNTASRASLVDVLELDGEEYLRYKPFTPDVALIRGSYADERGNLSFEDEPARLEALAVAQATHNAGGTVIAQVRGLVEAGSLDARLVAVPGFLVDAVVIHPEQRQMVNIAYDPALTGRTRRSRRACPPLPQGARRIIAHRALQEIRRGDVVNLGVGVAAGIAVAAVEEGRLDEFTLTVEQGPTGGQPAGDLEFGASYNPDTIIDQPSQFDFYDGGGLDVAFLGMAELDRDANVNVSYFNGRLFGTGGFVNISQGARRIVFCSTFTSGGLEVAGDDGALAILREGAHPKFVEAVQHRTFSGRLAEARRQDVMVVTERAVFRWVDGKLHLIELAPGVDLEKDVCRLVPFEIVTEGHTTMDPRLFRGASR